jgi:transaldolase / glucose-6-phosphate isomerase
VKVTLSGPASDSRSQLAELVEDKVASRIFAKDFTLWGKAAESESAIRLGWVQAASDSLKLLPELSVLRNELLASGITKVVLCGMGGSSLAPEVITATAGVELVVLDSTDPSQVESALVDLASTVVVVSSKSGSTVETDSQKRIFEHAFEQAGIPKTQRIIIVTDPDSPMEKQAQLDGYRIFRADPTVGGRYSALTAFGVVPSALAGVDLEPILRDAISASERLAQDHVDNPGLVLGAAMARTPGLNGYRDKLGLVTDGSSIIGLGDWLEQLIAESTGKIDRGVLPVVLSATSPEIQTAPDDLVLIGLAGEAHQSSFDVTVSGTIGSQLMLWEVATVVASRLLGINPFDQPDVESAKIAARALLESPAQSEQYVQLGDGVRGKASNLDLPDGYTLEQALQALVKSAKEDSYFAIQAYLNRAGFSQAAQIRELLAHKTKRPVTFGWGPRFLHSTGQYHKGGPKQGVFLQICSDQEFDLNIPGREFSFRQLITSQAEGDSRVLSETGVSILTLRFTDPEAGLKLLGGLLS